MTPQGGRKALDRLFEVGIVHYIGSGNRQQVSFRQEHPLASAIVELFDAEADRYRNLVKEIKSSVAELKPLPRAAWIQGPVAERVDEYGDPLIIGVLAGAKEVDQLAETLRDRLLNVEKDYDVTIEVRPYTEADLVAVSQRERQTLPLLGPDPEALLSDREGRGDSRLQRHEDHDARALERAERLAELLVREPGLRDRALRWLEEARETEGDDRELREWERILESTSIPRLRHLLTSDTDRAIRLRQSVPFWSILNERERDQVLAPSEDES